MTGVELSETFDRDGFVVVRQFLSGDELDELRVHLERYICQVVPTLPDTSAFYDDRGRPETLKQLQHMDGDPYFRQYKHHSHWVELAGTLLREPVEPQGTEWFNKPPGTEHATPPHQDNYYFNLAPPNVVTLWLALDEVDEENGCLRYVAGSHREGLRPHGSTRVLGFSQGIVEYSERDRQREVAVGLLPGDLVAHHGEAIHRADANRSPSRHRRSFALVCRGVSCRRNEAQYERYLASLQAQHSRMGLET